MHVLYIFSRICVRIRSYIDAGGELGGGFIIIIFLQLLDEGFEFRQSGEARVHKLAELFPGTIRLTTGVLDAHMSVSSRSLYVYMYVCYIIYMCDRSCIPYTYAIIMISVYASWPAFELDDTL